MLLSLVGESGAEVPGSSGLFCSPKNLLTLRHEHSQSVLCACLCVCSKAVGLKKALWDPGSSQGASCWHTSPGAGSALWGLKACAAHCLFPRLSTALGARRGAETSSQPWKSSLSLKTSSESSCFWTSSRCRQEKPPPSITPGSRSFSLSQRKAGTVHPPQPGAGEVSGGHC